MKNIELNTLTLIFLGDMLRTIGLYMNIEDMILIIQSFYTLDDDLIEKSILLKAVYILQILKAGLPE